MSQSIGLSIGYSRKRLKRLKRPSLSLNRSIVTTAIYILKNSDLKTKTKNNPFYLCVVKNYRPCCKKTKPKSEVVTSPESPQYYNFGGTQSAGDDVVTYDDVVTPNSNYQSLQLHQLQGPDIYTQLADQ